ncbi:hypothetical protein ACOMHN_060586 [Nucella lapillus]
MRSLAESVAVGALEVEHKEVDDATAREAEHKEVDEPTVHDGFFDDTDVRAILALAEDSAGDEDVEFDHGSELSDTWSVDLPQEYGDQVDQVEHMEVDDATVREAEHKEVDDATVGDEFLDEMEDGWLALAEDSAGDEDVEFDHGSDDEDDDEEGELAEQPAKKKTKKLPYV